MNSLETASELSLEIDDGIYEGGGVAMVIVPIRSLIAAVFFMLLFSVLNASYMSVREDDGYYSFTDRPISYRVHIVNEQSKDDKIFHIPKKVFESKNSKLFVWTMAGILDHTNCLMNKNHVLFIAKEYSQDPSRTSSFSPACFNFGIPGLKMREFHNGIEFTNEFPSTNSDKKPPIDDGPILSKLDDLSEAKLSRVLWNGERLVVRCMSRRKYRKLNCSPPLPNYYYNFNDGGNSDDEEITAAFTDDHYPTKRLETLYTLGEDEVWN